MLCPGSENSSHKLVLATTPRRGRATLTQNVPTRIIRVGVARARDQHMPKGNALANCHEKAAPLGAFMPPNSSSSVERAYMVPARWPLDAWHLIMETQPSTCDLYRVSSFCCQFGSETFSEPERHVWDAISSFLAHCPRRNERERCTAVDLGANNGWFTAIMLQHGSRVTAVEPSPNFANAVRETGEVNCWADRLTVHNARACIAEDTKCFAPVPSSCDGPGWRWGSGPSRMQTTLASCSATHAEATKVGGVDLRETLLRASRARARNSDWCSRWPCGSSDTRRSTGNLTGKH